MKSCHFAFGRKGDFLEQNFCPKALEFVTEHVTLTSWICFHFQTVFNFTLEKCEIFSLKMVFSFSVSNMFIASIKSWKRQNFSMKKVLNSIYEIYTILLHQWYHSLSKIESCGIYDSFQSSDFFCICFPGISLELSGLQGQKLMVAYHELSHEQSNVEPSEALITYVLKPTSPRKVNICSCEKFAWFLVSNYWLRLSGSNF